MSKRAAALIAGGITLAGFLLRAAQFDQSLFADELSTYWILDGNSLGEVLSSVHSDDEITPPLYFVLGWLSLQVGPDAEWVRLPSLLAGTAAIPLVYVLGARTISRPAGLVAAAVMALNPFMIYYAVEARSYALVVALLTASTVSLLLALDTGRVRWWAAYAAASCGAMLSHYTAVFPLLAQFLWVLWAHRGSVRPLLAANAAAVLAFMPWITGFLNDQSSPTTEILSALQPFELDQVRYATEAWAVGFPYVRLEKVPGTVAGVLIAAGLLIALVAGLVRARRAVRASRLRLGVWARRIPPRLVLVALLLAAAPVGEALYSAVGTNLYGARNLNASTPGLAVAIGGLVVAAGPALGLLSAALVLGGFGAAAARTFDSSLERVDYASAAAHVEEISAGREVVIDVEPLTPVPLTPLEVYLEPGHPIYTLGLPRGQDEPFLPGDPVPPTRRLIREALREADGRTLFLISARPGKSIAGAATAQAEALREESRRVPRQVFALARGYEIASVRAFAGLGPLVVWELRPRSIDRQ